jgi:hypothetical protein
MKGRKRRERERQDLRVLVGSSLTRLSQLNGLDLELYSKDVLPRLVTEITACRDELAQQHLFDSLVQVRLAKLSALSRGVSTSFALICRCSRSSSTTAR